MSRRPFYKLWRFWVVIAVLLFIVNIVLSICFRECGANIFTAFSGWISGIATVCIGVITLRQAEIHKKEVADRDIPEILIYDMAREDKNAESVPLRAVLNGRGSIASRTYKIQIRALQCIVNIELAKTVMRDKDNKIITQFSHQMHRHIVSFLAAQEIEYFSVELPKDTDFIDIEFIFEYENIFGTKYEKKVSFSYCNNVFNRRQQVARAKEIK